MAASTAIVNWMTQRIDRNCPDASATFFEPADFRWPSRIEARWREIRVELDVLLERPELVPAFHEVSERQAPLSDNRWKTFFICVFGHEIEGARALCPRTCEILRAIPGMKTAMLSILEDGKHIPPHRGPYKGVLRYHLGLIVPRSDESCAIRVGDDVRWWREGGSLVFDDTHVHEAWNHSGGRRVVLFVDFVRPLPGWLDVLNRLVLSVFGRLHTDVKEIRQKAGRYATGMRKA